MSTAPARESTQDLVAELSRHVRGDVRFDAVSRALYSTDASIYKIQPLGVVIPRDDEDVIATVEVAARHGVPVLPRGAGSSLAGQTVGAAIVLDFSRHFDKVLEVNEEEKWARVQSGVVLDHLNRHLKPYGLQYGPDPASSNRATMGGILGNNSTGAHSILYGMTVDHIQAVDTVLSDGSQAHFGPLSPGELANKREIDGLEGEIYRGVTGLVEQHHDLIRTGYPKVWRRVSGYNLDRLVGDAPFNLASLICGSEGTLATVTGIKVGLVEKPPRTALMVIHFDRFLDSMAATPRILEMNPSAVELMDGLLLKLTRDVPAYARHLDFVHGDPEALLMVEYYGENERELNAKLDELQAFLEREHLGGTRVRTTDPHEIGRIWGVRKVSLGLLMGIKGDYKPIPFIEDAAVPVEHLAAYIGQVRELCRDHDTEAGYYAHASAGCLHVRPLVNLKGQDGIDKMHAIAKGSFDLVAKYGGAISGEHGDGLVRSEFNVLVFGEKLYSAFRELKGAFDPHNIMNPGKVVDSPSMKTNLRYGPSYQTIHLDTIYDFSADMGFNRAVEMCNGMGVCRKHDGTMCPSFQATREEEHATRGRANLLRVGLSGAMSKEFLFSERMHGALDLCLECKACKGECPSGVDMAKIKAEWLFHYHREHGTPLRSKLFAHIHTLSKIGSAFAPLSNWAMRLPPARWLNEKLLGIHRERVLPEFARVPFHRQFKRRMANGTASRGQVVLFHDTFMTYNEPEIGLAAADLLEAAGYEVVLVENRVCCGRPMISKGLLKEAKANAARNVAALLPYVERGLPIVGCEPSCTLTIRDDYPELMPGEDANKVAGATITFEEFIAGEVEAGTLHFSDEAYRVMLHGHCHQKALVGTDPAKKALGLPANATVEEIPSGCCGMAGSFGYEREHYDLSLQIGELVLLPAVRAAGPDVTIAAAGMSCRHQIRHGAGREARHPVLVLRDALQNHESGRA